MLDFLLNLDTKLFLFLNGLHSEGMDPVMVWISGKTTWWPFYLALLIFLVWKARWKSLVILFFVALAVTLADQISVHLFKEVFERLRPCKEPELEGLVHLVNGKCGGLYGFVSSHSANVFAVAVFLVLVIRRRWFTFLLLFWAALVGYSRIYLGVHYPGDVLGGALLGAGLAYGLVYLYHLLLAFLQNKTRINFE